MTNMTLGTRLETAPVLQIYATLLPLGSRALDEAVGRELTDNPWLELVERPLVGLGDDVLRDVASGAPSLIDALEGQLDARSLSRAMRGAAGFVVGSLDAQAYLRETDEQIARGAGVNVREAQCVVAIVQSLEPAGVAARSLGERFRLQLARSGETQTLAFVVAAELDALAAQGAGRFAHDRAIARADLDAALQRLRRCDPDPTRDYDHRIDRVYPEIVFARANDRIEARIDGRYWPHVRVASLELPKRDLSEPMRRARSRARLVVEALARRRTTLERLAAALLAGQHRFLASDGDPALLAPLTGRELARTIGCAESTISRALADRYASTPFGTIALRALVARSPGKIAMTSASVREAIRAIISGSPQLSDEAVARALALRGIRLARRTVSKYRAMLGVQSSRRRRRV